MLDESLCIIHDDKNIHKTQKHYNNFNVFFCQHE
jgi:hypothetical protein